MNRGDYMYHRYIPNESGGFERVLVEQPEQEAQSLPEQAVQSAVNPLRALLPKQTDTGDLLLILIVLLLLQEGGKDDVPTALILLAALIFG